MADNWMESSRNIWVWGNVLVWLAESLLLAHDITHLSTIKQVLRRNDTHKRSTTKIVITNKPIILLPIALRPFQFALAFPYNWCPFHSIHCLRSHRFTPSFLKSSSSFIHLSLGHHSRWLTSYPYSYFVCMVVFLNLSSIPYMVSEQLTFFGMELSAPCPTPCSGGPGSLS
jgi:hypothetical protein